MNEYEEINNAINDLMIIYQKALKSEYIYHPVGYALYKTWRKYDAQYKKNKEKEKELNK